MKTSLQLTMRDYLFVYIYGKLKVETHKNKQNATREILLERQKRKKKKKGNEKKDVKKEEEEGYDGR